MKNTFFTQHSLLKTLLILGIVIISSMHIEAKTIYFKNTRNWSTPYFYYWNGTSNNGWNSQTMTNITGTNIWYAETDNNKVSNPVSCIFHNNNGIQTNNLSFKEGNIYIPKDNPDNYFDCNIYTTFSTSAAKLYFDISNVTDWGNIYFRLGRGKDNDNGPWCNAYPGTNNNTQFKLVKGTKYLYERNLPDWEDYEAFSIANGSGQENGNSIYQPGEYTPTGNNVITKQTIYFNSANNNGFNIIDKTIYVKPTTISDQNSNCSYYNFIYDNTALPQYTIKINSAENGSISVEKYNDNNGDDLTTILSSGKVNPTQIIKITTTPNNGYEAQQLTVTNATKISDGVYYVTGDAEISAKFVQTDTKHTVYLQYQCEGEDIITSADNIAGIEFSKSIGEVNAVKITAPDLNGYAFKNWTLGDGINSTTSLENKTIEVTTKSSGTYTLTANYEEDLSTSWYIAGQTSSKQTGSPFQGWAEQGIPMFKKSGESTKEIYYCKIDVSTTIDESITTGEKASYYEFKVYNSNNTETNDGYYQSDGYWVTKQHHTDITLDNQEKQGNMIFKPNVKGKYEFKIDNTGSSPILTVTWPEVIYYVTIKTTETTRNWLKNIYVYHDGNTYNAPYPGQPLSECATKINEDTWLYEFSSKYSHLILNDGTDNNTNKTYDIPITGNTCITLTGFTNRGEKNWDCAIDNDCQQIYYRVRSDVGENAYYSNIVAQLTDDVSFYYSTEGTTTIEKWENNDWENYNNSTISLSEKGVYVGTCDDIANAQLYTGDYKLFSNAVSLGVNHKNTNDNKFVYFSTKNDEFTTNPYTHYWVDWVIGDKNLTLTATVGNDINPNLALPISSNNLFPSGISNGEGVNARFEYNPQSNHFGFTPLTGSLVGNRFLMMYDDGKNTKFLKRYESNDPYNEITTPTDYIIISSSQASGDYRNAEFEDISNWVYKLDVKATGKSHVTIVAFVNEQEQFLFGGDVTNRREINLMNDDIKDELTMRVIYDFKTNRLIAAWLPDDNTPIQSTFNLDASIMMSRHGNGIVNHKLNIKDNATDGNVSVLNVEQAYIVVELEEEDGYTDDNSDPNVRSFFFSLPFNCTVGDIFGFSGSYLDKWALLYYDGAKRAQRGWFSDTGSFWTVITNEDYELKAGEGYLLQIAHNAFSWKDGRNEALTHRLYFPSNNTQNINISNSTKSITVPAHEYKGPTHSGNNIDHTITDRDWNFVGIPNYNDASATFNPKDGINDQLETAENFYYEWDDTNNKWVTTSTAAKDTKFVPTFAYMFQYGGQMNFTSAPRTAAAAGITARHQSSNTSNQSAMLDIELIRENQKQDHTYIQLVEGAIDGFDAGYDLTKVDNEGDNIYTRIYSSNGMYVDLAANNLPSNTTNVPLLLTASQNDEYTFHKNEQYNLLEVVLYDKIEDRQINLDFADYTIYLNAGEYTDRFELILSRKQSETTTDVENKNTGNAESTENAENKFHFSQIGNQLFIDSLTQPTSVVMYDLTGKMLYSTPSLSQGEGLPTPQPGIYLININDTTQKIVVK